MSDEAPKGPAYEAFAVREEQAGYGRTRTRWTKIGAAWWSKKENEQGQKSISLRLEALPTDRNWDGTVMLLPPRPREAREPRAQAPATRGEGAPPSGDDEFPPPDDDIPF